MKKIVLKGLLEQAEQLSREQQKNVVGGYETNPTYRWLYCRNSAGYNIGSLQTTTCSYSTNLGYCQSVYPETVSIYVQGC